MLEETSMDSRITIQDIKEEDQELPASEAGTSGVVICVTNDGGDTGGEDFQFLRLEQISTGTHIPSSAESIENTGEEIVPTEASKGTG